MRYAIAVIGLAVGVAGFAVESRAPGLALVDGMPTRLLELVAGWALLACAVAGRSRWLLATVVAWFAAEWDNPAAGSSLLFTAGLVAAAATGPLGVRAALSHPAAAAPGRERRAGLVAVVCSLAVAGVAAAAFADPRGEGCSQCPHNLLLVHADQPLADALRLAGAAAAAVVLAALTIAIVERLARMEPVARAARMPLLGPAILLAATSAATLAVAVPAQGAARIALAGALLVLAAGIAVGRARRRRARAAIARLVIQAAPQPGGLATALGRTLGDPELRIAYPLADGRLVDADGLAVDAAAGPGEAVTAIVGDGRVLAQLVHRVGLLGAPGLADEIVAAAQLGLQHERLAAEVRARVADLRASRGRIVAAGDAERARLERNLHDGAQQQLVALMLELRLARAAARDADHAVRIDTAAREVAAALDELRRLAGGLFPPALADGGLKAALSALAEEAPVPIELLALPAERVPASAETAAYFVTAGLVRAASSDGVTITAGVDDGMLWLELLGATRPDRIALEDRIGALDGELYVAPDGNGRTRYRMELPCAS